MVSHAAANGAAGESNGRAGVPAPSADRTLTLLETLLRQEEPITLTALAAEAGIPLATCGAMMQTFEQRGYAVRRVIGRSHLWRATLRVYALASDMMRRIDLSTVSQPFLQEVSRTLSVAAHVGVLDGGHIVYVARAASPGFVQFDTYQGKIAPYHNTALGRAIAAYLGPAEQAALTAELSPGRGPRGLAPNRDALLAELTATRLRAYAVEDEEEEPGIGCVAVPLLGTNDEVVAALGVTGFAEDLLRADISRVVELLHATAGRLSTRLGYTGKYPPNGS